jgi:hypothetical protein
MERRIGQHDHRLKGADRTCNLRNGFVDLFQMITISIDRGIEGYCINVASCEWSLGGTHSVVDWARVNCGMVKPKAPIDCIRNERRVIM